MSKDWDPSSVHRALSSEFLTPIADRIWRVQRKVSRHVQPHEGDDNWVAGTTAYRRRTVALTNMSREPEYQPWMWAGHIDGHFSIKIHGFPIRIYRSPEEGAIPTKYTLGSPGELIELLTLPGVNSRRCIYRLEVEAGKLGRPIDIFIVEVDIDRQEIVNSASVPRSRNVDAPIVRTDSGIRPIRRRKPPIVPPKPKVKPNEEKKRPETGDEEKPA